MTCVGLMLAAGLSILPGWTAGPATLTPKGEATLDFSGATIWTGHDASDQEVTAAKEIQRYLFRISGKKLRIRTLGSSVPKGTPAIVVGTVRSVPFPEKAGEGGNTPGLFALPDEAFYLAVQGDNGAPAAHIVGVSPKVYWAVSAQQKAYA